MDRRELQNFFASRGADSDCPACGYDGAWLPLEEDSDLYLPSKIGPVPVTAVICHNCGFVRLHSLAAIRGDFGDPDERVTD